MEKKKILVTGGAGFIGSHTIVELLEIGYEVVCVDDLSNSEKSIVDNIVKITGKEFDFHQIDLCDINALKDVVEKSGEISGIIHFGAFKAVGESVSQPHKYYRNNILSLLNLIEIFGDKNVNFVFSSSCTVYGEPKQLPVNENFEVQKPKSPYGNTKKIAEEILEDITLGENNKMKIVSLRYFNPVGAHQSGLIGELPIGVPQNLFPYIMQTASGIRKELTIHGSDYNTPDGTCVRDYIHVVDLAKAHITALKYMEGSDQKLSVFNVGTGVGLSVLDIVKTFEKVTGLRLNYKLGPRRPGDISQIWADPQKINEILKWKAELGIEEMISSSWKWQKNINPGHR